MDFVAKSSFVGYTNVGFTGQRIDQTLSGLNNGDLEMMYYKNRWYDTETGRFMSHDPLGVVPEGVENSFSPIGQYTDGLNTYQYVINNPILFIDMIGLDSYKPGYGCNGHMSCMENELNGLQDVDSCAGVVAGIIKLFYLNATDSEGAVINKDKFAHCYISCRLTQACGAGSAMALGIIKEAQDESQYHQPAIATIINYQYGLNLPVPPFDGRGNGWEHDDMGANVNGIAIGFRDKMNEILHFWQCPSKRKRKKSCEENCNFLYGDPDEGLFMP